MPKAFRLFLQGGFAKCYELVDTETQEVFAGKIVPKSILLKPHHREKVYITSECSGVALNTFRSTF